MWFQANINHTFTRFYWSIIVWSMSFVVFRVPCHLWNGYRCDTVWSDPWTDQHWVPQWFRTKSWLLWYRLDRENHHGTPRMGIWHIIFPAIPRLDIWAASTAVVNSAAPMKNFGFYVNFEGCTKIWIFEKFENTNAISQNPSSNIWLYR